MVEGPVPREQPSQNYYFHALRRILYGLCALSSWPLAKRSAPYSARQCGYRASPQSPGGGVFSQAMPLSVILKTVAPTRVALGLGSI